MLFTGDMYIKSGFIKLYDSKPGFKYFKQNCIKSRESLQKHKLSSIIQNYDSNMSASKNLEQAGWNKIWDCGNGVYVLL